MKKGGSDVNGSLELMLPFFEIGVSFKHYLSDISANWNGKVPFMESPGYKNARSFEV